MCGKLEGDSPDDEHLFRFGYALPTHLLLPEHKATYWAITDDEARLEGYERATALFNEQFDTEDKQSWREHAPRDSHPSVESEP